MKKNYFIIFLISFFIFIINSNATVYLDNNLLTKNQVVYHYSGNVSITIETPYYTLKQGQPYNRLYGVVALCTNNTSLQNASSSNVSVQYTDIACTLPPNVDTTWPDNPDGVVPQIYDGNLVYLIVSWDIFDNIPNDQTLLSRKFTATFTVENSPWHPYALIQDMYSYEPIDFDLSSKTLIEQNKEIIKQNEETNKKLDEQNQKVQQEIEEQQKTNQELGELNDNLTNSNVDSGSASGFFDNFQDNDHGLSGIINAPLNFIKNLNSKSCSPINVSIPLINSNFSLPCMSSFYNTHFAELFRIYQIVIFGLISYRICLDIFRIVKGFKDPDSDKVEVLDL